VQPLEQQAHDGRREVRREPVAVRGAQEVAHGDRPARRDGVVDRRRGRAQDPWRGDLRQHVADGVIERDVAVRDEREDGDGGDRLARRRDAEQRVLPHRRAAHGVVSRDRHVHVVAARHDGDETGDLPGIDEGGERGGHRSHDASLPPGPSSPAATGAAPRPVTLPRRPVVAPSTPTRPAEELP
jgi:hypothetical protein